jgi:hypothetical protein
VTLVPADSAESDQRSRPSSPRPVPATKETP